MKKETVIYTVVGTMALLAADAVVNILDDDSNEAHAVIGPQCSCFHSLNTCVHAICNVGSFDCCNAVSIDQAHINGIIMQWGNQIEIESTVVDRSYVKTHTGHTGWVSWAADAIIDNAKAAIAAQLAAEDEA